MPAKEPPIWQASSYRVIALRVIVATADGPVSLLRGAVFTPSADAATEFGELHVEATKVEVDRHIAARRIARGEEL
jgi:hypothetical protein